jgi:hypothetical protein
METAISKERRFRKISFLLAVLLLVCGAWRLVTPLAAAVNPLWSTARISCTPACTAVLDPVRLLDRELRDGARGRPGVEERIRAGARSGAVHASVAAARTLKALPEAIFFFSLAAASLAFSRSGIQRKSLRWLRRAAWSALLYPIAGAAAHALNSFATTPLILANREVHLGIYPQELILGLAAAAGLWLIIWAMDEALSLRTDLDDYV